METMEQLRDIIRKNGMSIRPEYYSGRGATLTDLDDKILEGIYTGIVKEFGEKAGESFVKMVNGIKVLSATTFLQELFMLHGRDWKYRDGNPDAPGVVVPKDADGNYDLELGMLGIASALSIRNDDTRSIKFHFCSRHGIKQEAPELYRESDGRAWCY